MEIPGYGAPVMVKSAPRRLQNTWSIAVHADNFASRRNPGNRKAPLIIGDRGSVANGSLLGSSVMYTSAPGTGCPFQSTLPCTIPPPVETGGPAATAVGGAATVTAGAGALARRTFAALAKPTLFRDVAGAVEPFASFRRRIRAGVFQEDGDDAAAVSRGRSCATASIRRSSPTPSGSRQRQLE